MGTAHRLKLTLVIFSTLCFVLRVCSSFTYYKTYKDGKDWCNVTIPKTGYYVVTITVDPKPGRSLHVQLRGNRNIAAFGDFIVGSLSFALVLRAGQRIGVEWPSSKSGWIDGETSLSVAYVSDSARSGEYTLTRLVRTLRESDEALMVYTAPRDGVRVRFLSVFKNNYWVRYTREVFPVYHTGIFWFSARPDPVDGHAVVVTVHAAARALFSIYAAEGRAISTSGAFYVQRGSFVYLTIDRGRTLKPATVLSYVFLASNRRPHTGSYKHIAWTARTPAVDYIQNNRYRFLAKDILTDYGNMYEENLGAFFIHRDGSYLVSLRVNPVCHNCTVKGSLFLNFSPKWNVWSEMGTASGQSVAFNFKDGDILHVQAEGSNKVAFMLSVAFLGPD